MKMVDIHHDSFRRALRKGVKIALGTDAGGFDWSAVNEAKELEYYVRLGMTPMQAIESGTRVAAELLDMGDRVLSRTIPIEKFYRRGNCPVCCVTGFKEESSLRRN